jgi:hypothetical protein
MYKSDDNDLHIVEAYETVTGVKLGVWARNQRCLYAAKMHLEMHGSKVANNNAASCFNLLDNQLCQERINLLTNIEFPWDMPPRFARSWSVGWWGGWLG